MISVGQHSGNRLIFTWFDRLRQCLREALDRCKWHCVDFVGVVVHRIE